MKRKCLNCPHCFTDRYGDPVSCAYGLLDGAMPIGDDGRKFEVRPDVVADFTSMPYDDCSFSGVVFDPPHLKYSGSEKESKGWQMTKYGFLGADWKETLSRGFAECFRVLKPGGFLIFKWNETDIKLSQILALTSVKPLLGHRSGKRSNTHWVLFVK